jgi:lipoprotein-releasing system ATP-binding protein
MASLAARSGRSLALRIELAVDSPRSQPLLRLERLERAYTQGNRRIDVLRGASASFYPGETVALLGPSGAGKSTLLHIAGLLERPDKGAVIINGVECGRLSDSDQTRMRRMEVGFVYQFHHLLPEFSALENVVLPQLILGLMRDKAEERARELLTSLGLDERWDHRPAQLSGGEQQRVAIARAVANDPKVLLADEPTGNLDPPTAERVFEQLLALVQNSGVAAVVATHNLDLAARMDRTLRLADGLLIEEDLVVAKIASS